MCRTTILWGSVVPSCFQRLPTDRPVTWTLLTDSGWWYDLLVNKSQCEITLLLLGRKPKDPLPSPPSFLLIHTREQLLQFLLQLSKEGWKIQAVAPLKPILGALFSEGIQAAMDRCSEILSPTAAK